ncbi:MAG TPA: hypothetical protein VLB27_10325, partial [candidate division Zixibacteria bacterium]|nr:hypothetical protein [candidate division Zixibacteria bacterium]
MSKYNKSKFTLPTLALLALLTLPGSAVHADDNDKGPAPVMSADVAQIVERLLAAEQAQQNALSDITLDGLLFERRLKGDGETKEEKRFEKTLYFLRREDSVRYWNVHEVFKSYGKDGEAQETDKLQDEVKDKLDKQKKGRRNDKGRPITDVFLPRFREHYSYNYAGVVDTP